MMKRKRRKEYVPTINTPLKPYAERREAILAEVKKWIDGTSFVGIPVNNKWNIQLKDRSNQKSKDIRRMIKEGDLVMKRGDGVQGHLSGKRCSYVTLKH